MALSVVFYILISFNSLFESNSLEPLPLHLIKLRETYPQINSLKSNSIIFQDNQELKYDDGEKKSFPGILDNADIEDMFSQSYPKEFKLPIAKNFDPGRIRSEAFFRKIYGNTKAEVESNLVEIIWCPKLINQKIKVTRVNGVSDKFIKLSAELDNHPEWKKYLMNVGGTYNWRKIAGTNRLSHHSFGTTIDLNVKYSNYWQWDNKTKNELAEIKYKNQIPLELVAVFEKYGFIWGGKWYHYDTMHFEYRPELL